MKNLCKYLVRLIVLIAAIIGFTAVGNSHANPLTLPFKSQVPPGEWAYTNNCGQTSALMVMCYHKGTIPTEQGIKDIDDWLFQEYGDSINNYNGSVTNTTKLETLVKEYGGFINSYKNSGWSLSNLKQQIDDELPIIAAVTAGYLSNRGYDYAGGHFLVVIGYTDTHIICNDPGTNAGAEKYYSNDEFSQAFSAQNGSVVMTVVQSDLASDFIAWTRKADMPAVTGGTPVAVNGKIYVFGGWDSDLAYEYDPLSDAWTQKASMPQARGGTVALFANGEIYIAGGNPTPNGSLRLDAYDTETDLWQSKASMPHDLWGGWGVAGGVVNSKLYVIGGYNWPNHEEDYCREYDITADSWSLKTPMPTAVEWMNAAVHNDKIYVVGGQYGTGTHTLLDYIQVYDPSNDSWDIIQGLLIYLQGSGVIAYNNKLYIFGGDAGSPPFPILSSQKERNLTVYSYDFNSGVFTEEGDMPTEDGGQVCLINNKIYLIGAGENNNEIWEGLFFIHGEEIIHQEQIIIQQNKTVEANFNIFEYATELIVSRIIQGSDVKTSLIQPDGAEINRENAKDLNVYHALGATYEVYKINNPMLGEWTARLFGAEVPTGGELTDLTVSVNIIVDEISPEITLSVSPNILWPPNHKMVLITPTIAVADNCDPDPIVELSSITMNEKEKTKTKAKGKTKGNGHTVDDIYVDENGNIYLRAERLGTGDGRIYTITYTATDASGNDSVARATVTVPHNQ